MSLTKGNLVQFELSHQTVISVTGHDSFGSFVYLVCFSRGPFATRICGSAIGTTSIVFLKLWLIFFSRNSKKCLIAVALTTKTF